MKLGFNITPDMLNQASIDKHESMTSILDLVRLSGMINRHVQLLQTLRSSSLSSLTKFEWIYCRLFLNEIGEVLEYIDFSKQLDGYSGLDDISNLLQHVNAQNTRSLRHVSKVGDIFLMHEASKKIDFIGSSFEGINEMQEFSVAIESQFFDR